VLQVQAGRNVFDMHTCTQIKNTEGFNYIEDFNYIDIEIFVSGGNRVLRTSNRPIKLLVDRWREKNL